MLFELQRTRPRGHQCGHQCGPGALTRAPAFVFFSSISTKGPPSIMLCELQRTQPRGHQCGHQCGPGALTRAHTLTGTVIMQDSRYTMLKSILVCLSKLLDNLSELLPDAAEPRAGATTVTPPARLHACLPARTAINS